MVKCANHASRLAAVLFLFQAMVLAAPAWAGDNTGKIAGTVRDKKSNEPLVGVNVAVKGTTLGASTDVNGFYYILRVPPGTHDLQASIIGYKIVTVKGVRVQGDLTSEINISMEQTEVELDEVTITAEQKIVQKDVTSTRRTVSRETLAETPGMQSALDVFKLQGGTFVSSVPQTLKLADGTQLQVRDESLQDVHIRGGRGGEILYMVDGMPVTHPIYGGRSVMDLNISDVESVELLTGAFNAEYGQAQSGVVNITTRSGTEKYSGGLELKTDRWKALGSPFNTDYGSFYLSGPEPLTSGLFPLLGLSVPGKMSFFLSANLNLTDTPYDNRRQRGKLPLLFWDIAERQDNTRNANGKITWDITGEHKLALSYHGSWKQWSPFDWLWNYYPNSMPDYKRNNIAANLMYNQVLSKSTYYTLNLGYLGVAYKGSWHGLPPSAFWYQDSTGRYVSRIVAPQIDPGTSFFDERGTEALWRDDNTKTLTFKGDFTSQVHPAHLLKTGVEVQYNDISYIDIEDGGTKLSNFGMGNDPIAPPGPYPLFGQTRWVFKVKPLIGSAYIQDKYELEFLILNAGVRLDWFDLGNTVMGSQWKNVWHRATGLEADWKRLKYKISPRFGVSFPISENTVVFFSYGHFNQLPELQFYYRDPYNSTYTGNPKLDYEQTILYEFGFTHQLSDSWVIDIKSYAKDISKQVGSTLVVPDRTKDSTVSGTPIQLYDNNGYGRARGLEFELTKVYSNYISGKGTYTIQWTNGYSSSAFDDYVRSINNFPNPIRERPLAWDIRHQVIFQGTVSVPPRQHPEVFGLPLPDDWNLTVLYRYATGSPYTPGDATLSQVEQQKRENTATGPGSSNTDLKFEKGFDLWGVRLAFTVESLSIGFNPWTGKPYVYGDVERPQLNYYDYYTMIAMRDPRIFSTGRTTKVGLRVDF
jgi:outer membrane receptor for ferrienterochelin and colicin